MSDTAMFSVINVKKGDPGNNLPKWVRNIAKTRGYGDAAEDMSTLVVDEDIDTAFELKAQGQGDACVLAQMGKRLGARQIYFYRGWAWIDFGSGPLVRFKVSNKTRNAVVVPFDNDDREAIKPGVYTLNAPPPSQQLGAAERRRARRQKELAETGEKPTRRNKVYKRQPTGDFSRVIRASEMGKTLTEKVLK